MHLKLKTDKNTEEINKWVCACKNIFVDTEF